MYKQGKEQYPNAVIPMREILTHPYNQQVNDGIRRADYLLEAMYTVLNEYTASPRL